MSAVFPYSRLIAAVVKDLVSVVSKSNSDGEFESLHARAPSFPGVIQRLEEIVSLQLETRQYKDVEDFDFIGMSSKI
jgi:hypothetical protein